MMKTRILLSAAAIILVACGGAMPTNTLPPLTAIVAFTPPPLPTPSLPDPILSPPDGPIGITPHLPDGDPNAPTFTADDATAYVFAHPDFGKIAIDGPITVTSVAFLPASQAGYYSVPDRLVCVVNVTGMFHLEGPPSGNPASGTIARHVAHFQTAFEMFDAHTGGLIAEGGK